MYISSSKMHLFAPKLALLGNVVTDKGIQLDPHKVDSIAQWKTPTNKSLLSSFLGAVGFVARGCKGIRVPMGALTPLVGTKSTWRWGPTEERAFQEVKTIVEDHREVYTRPIDDGPNAPPLNVTTDASLTGAGATLSQGEDLKKANYVAFYSAKFNAAQQNYPTHERELLAVVEALNRFRHMLIGRHFACTQITRR